MFIEPYIHDAAADRDDHARFDELVLFSMLASTVAEDKCVFKWNGLLNCSTSSSSSCRVTLPVHSLQICPADSFPVVANVLRRKKKAHVVEYHGYQPCRLLVNEPTVQPVCSLSSHPTDSMIQFYG